jgi:diguanylate cyclase (GGDEF)-like protein
VIYDKIRKKRSENGKFGVLFVDLDNFKRINDVYGHTAGDQVLIDFSSALSKELPKGSLLGRFGGDEFVMVTDSVEQIDELINIIYALLKNPLNIKGRHFYLATSIGVATWPKDGETTELLLRNADLALYQAKRAGRNQAMSYVPQFEHEANKWLMTGDVFRQALLDKSFTYYWQPVVNTHKEVIFYELLLRLETNNGETILPGDFLSIAEESGLMGNIAEFTVEFALNAVQKLQNNKPVRLSLNLSRSQLLLSNLDKLIEPLVDFSAQIIIEVTEDAFLGGVDTLIALKRLKGLGFTIALDDFGTGYSSLSLLSDLPVDIVKLDKKFQQKDSSEINASAMFDAIINMLHALGKTVVAEGIESTDQHQQAIMAGCDYYQGFYFGRPSPALVDSDTTITSTPHKEYNNLITLNESTDKRNSGASLPTQATGSTS